MMKQVRGNLKKMNIQNIKTKETNMDNNLKDHEPFKLNLRGEDFEFYSKKQLLKKLNISSMTLEKWRSEGLKSYKIGKSKTHSVRYKKKHIEDFLDRYLQT